MHLVLQGHEWLIDHYFHDKKFEIHIGEQKNAAY
jgi:hypothetical protein